MPHYAGSCSAAVARGLCLQTDLMRVLVIDESKRNAQIMRRFLPKRAANAEVSVYDPIEHGMPDPSFDWSGYDVLLFETLETWAFVPHSSR